MPQAGTFTLDEAYGPDTGAGTFTLDEAYGQPQVSDEQAAANDAAAREQQFPPFTRRQVGMLRSADKYVKTRTPQQAEADFNQQLAQLNAERMTPNADALDLPPEIGEPPTDAQMAMHRQAALNKPGFPLTKPLPYKSGDIGLSTGERVATNLLAGVRLGPDSIVNLLNIIPNKLVPTLGGKKQEPLPTSGAREAIDAINEAQEAGGMQPKDKAEAMVEGLSGIVREVIPFLPGMNMLNAPFQAAKLAGGFLSGAAKLPGAVAAYTAASELPKLGMPAQQGGQSGPQFAENVALSTPRMLMQLVDGIGKAAETIANYSNAKPYEVLKAIRANEMLATMAALGFATKHPEKAAEIADKGAASRTDVAGTIWQESSAAERADFAKLLDQMRAQKPKLSVADVEQLNNAQEKPNVVQSEAPEVAKAPEAASAEAPQAQGGNGTAGVQADTQQTLSDSLRAKLDSMETDALAYIKSQGATVRSGLDPKLIGAYVQYGASQIGKGIVTAADFAKHMVEKFGDEIKPHLDAIWAQAQKVFQAAARPDLANPGMLDPARRVMDIADTRRNEAGEPQSIPHEYFRQAASGKLAQDFSGEKARIEQNVQARTFVEGDTAVAGAIENRLVMEGVAANDAAKIEDAIRFGQTYREGRSIIGRELGLGRDQIETPEQRASMLARVAIQPAEPLQQAIDEATKAVEDAKRDVVPSGSARPSVPRPGAVPADTVDQGQGGPDGRAGSVEAAAAPQDRNGVVDNVPAKPKRKLGQPTPEAAQAKVKKAQQKLDALMKQAAQDAARNISSLRKVGIDVSNPAHLQEIATDGDKAARFTRIIQSGNSSIGSKLLEWRFASMFGALRTWGPLGVKAISDAANGALHFVGERPLQAVMAGGPLTARGRAKLAAVPDSARALLPALPVAFRMWAKTWKTELPWFDVVLRQRKTGEPEGIAALRVAQSRPRAIGGKAGIGVRVPLTGLLSTSQFYDTLYTHMEAAAEAGEQARLEGLRGDDVTTRATELLTDYNSDPWKKAEAMGDRLTFSEDTALARAIKAMSRGLDQVGAAIGGKAGLPIPIGKLLMPTRTTPANIIEQGLQLTPLGVIPWAFRIGRAIKSGEGLPEAWESGARTLIGTAATLALGSVIDWEHPRITGTAPDGKEPKLSLWFMGGWHSYASIPEPISVALATVVDMLQGFHKGGGVGEQASRAWHSALNQIVEKPFMRGLADVIEALQAKDDSKLAAWASSFAISWVPRAIVHADRALQATIPERAVWGHGDDRMRRLAQRTIDGAGLGFARRAIGFGDDEQPRYDLQGQPLPAVQIPNAPLTDFLYRTFVPSDIRPGDGTPIGQLLRNWNNAHPSESWYPLAPANFIEFNGKQIYMSDEQKARYAKTAGDFATQAVAEEVAAKRDPLNVESPTAADVKVVKTIIENSRKAARMMILEELDKAGKLETAPVR